MAGLLFEAFSMPRHKKEHGTGEEHEHQHLGHAGLGELPHQLTEKHQHADHGGDGGIKNPRDQEIVDADRNHEKDDACRGDDPVELIDV